MGDDGVIVAITIVGIVKSPDVGSEIVDAIHDVIDIGSSKSTRAEVRIEHDDESLDVLIAALTEMRNQGK